MNVNIDWEQLSEEKKRALIKALGDGLFFLICRKLQLDYFDIKKKLGL